MGKGFFHVVLMPEDGGQVRNFRITGRMLRGIIGGLILLVLALGASLTFHVRTFQEAQRTANLRAENAALRDQLDGFRRTVDELSRGIEQVGQREREARLLAGLEPVDEQTRELGIGGPELQIEPPAAVRGETREVIRAQGRKLDALARQMEFQQRSYSEVLTALASRREQLANTPTICPIRAGYTLSSGFGSRTDPFTGRSGRHNGLDLRAAPGTPVIAPADARVSYVGYNGDFGLTIQLDHGSGIETAYCHLSSASVRVGSKIRRGDRIGAVGTSGRSTGPHLHYEVMVGGRPVDPSDYVLTPRAIVD
jgi:murein DD-endopeptidase MepM/ murein hydrolase activator NlpD